MSIYAANALFWLLFIFICTSFGALAACLFSHKILDRGFPFIGGFSSGIMVAASVWSLIIPAMENSVFYGVGAAIEIICGFLIGGIFILLIVKFLPENDEGSFKSLFIAVTIHNIPEGLAVGFAFGALGQTDLTLAAAIGVAFGIGIQNIPEGAAVALPARKAYGKKKSLFFGSMSGIVEPIAGIIGFFLAEIITPLLSSLMSFAAGAMVFAALVDILPEALEKNRIKGSVGFFIGFLIMMSLDILL